MLTVSRTVIDFARRWCLLRISMCINISLVSDFFIKLLKLPMSFFDTKLMGDLMQRMSDHSRVNTFLTQQTLNITFAMLTFVVFSVVLFIYNKVVFAIFLFGSILYGGWMALFCSAGRSSTTNSSNSKLSTTTEPTSLSPPCKKSSCRIANNGNARNGRKPRSIFSECSRSL